MLLFHDCEIKSGCWVAMRLLQTRFSYTDLEDLVYVNAAMVDQADHWMRIGGMSLKISQPRLDIIKANHPEVDVGKCLIEMLDEWLRNSRKPTWAAVVEAIHSVDEKAAVKVAEQLQGILHVI